MTHSPNLPAGDRAKLGKLLALLGSSQSGERDAAGLAAHRLLERSGLSWRQVLEPPAVEKKLPQLGTWRTTCSRLLEHPHNLWP